MLAPQEYIIKFEDNTKKTETWNVATTQTATTTADTSVIKTPQAAWKKFLQDTIK
jgi:hypothetical protein